MAKDPAFLFYPNDFLSGTQFFSDEQVGKFMRILMAQHQHGHLSEEQVIFICKSHDKHIFSKLVQDSAGRWYNKRLEIEIEKRKNFVLSRSKNKEGKTKPKITSKSYENHMVNEDEIVIADEIVLKYESFEKKFESAFDEITLENYKINFPKLDLTAELSHFMLKCNSAKSEYHTRDPDGLRLGFLTQLKNSKSFKSNGTIGRKQEKNITLAKSTIEHYSDVIGGRKDG